AGSGVKALLRTSHGPTEVGNEPLKIIYLHVLSAAVSIVVLLASITVLVLDLDNDPFLLICGGAAAIVVTIPACSYVVRRVLSAHRISQKNRADQEHRLDSAINSMHQGLVVFDKDNRAVVINRRYLEMYRLPAEKIKPHCTLRELLEQRAAVGMFSENI